MGSSMHIVVEPSLKNTLKIFAKDRKKSMTYVINRALASLFNQEDANYAKHNAIQTVIDRKFSIPKVYTLKAFYVTLYMNATHYPNASAKSYWGNLVYLSEIGKTNKQLFTEIQEELKRELGR